jgi:tripartite-type tricarboxylate transporter receptor subunit TctC
VAWFGLFVPAKTPAPIIGRRNREANEAFDDPEVRRRLEAQGPELPLGTPEALRARVEADSRRRGEGIRRANIKLE